MQTNTFTFLPPPPKYNDRSTLHISRAADILEPTAIKILRLPLPTQKLTKFRFFISTELIRNKITLSEVARCSSNYTMNPLTGEKN